MGISSRVIRKFLAYKFFIFGSWFVALLPWFLWGVLHTQTGQELLSAQVNTYIEKLYPKTYLVWKGVHFDPSQSFELSSLSLYGSTKEELFSIEGMRLEWGLRKGIQLDVERVKIETDSSLWAEFSSQDTSTSSEVFSWNNPLSVSIPFSCRLANILLMNHEKEEGNIQYTMTGMISDSIEIDDLYIGGRWNKLPRVEMHGAFSYKETQVQIDRMEVSTQGGDIFIHGGLDATTSEVEMQGRVRVEKLGLSSWLNHTLPAVDLTLPYSLTGDAQRMSFSGALEGKGKMGIKLLISPLLHSWDIVLQPERFVVSALAPSMMEETILNGEYRLNGESFSIDSTKTHIDIEAKDEVLWGQRVQSWETSLSYASSILNIQQFTMAHALGHMQTQGTLDIEKQQGSVQAKLVLDRMEELLVYGVKARGELSYEGGLDVIWKDDITALIKGRISGQRLSYEEYQLMELMGDIELDYQAGNIEGDISIAGFDFEGGGLRIKELTAQQHMLIAEKENIQGSLSLRGVQVPGTMEIARIQGTNSMSGITDIYLEGFLEQMTLFDTGVMYDRGDFIAQLQGEKIQSTFSVFEQERDILDVKLLGDKETGIWAFERFRFAPLDGVEWNQESPSKFELTDGSIQKGSVHVTSKVGELHVDLVRDRGSLGILGIELSQLHNIANHIMGRDLLGTPIQGQVFADIQWNKREMEGSLDVRNLVYDEYAQGLGIKTKVLGEWNHPTVTIQLEGGKSLMDIEASIPLTIDYGIDCSRFGSIIVEVPAQNIVQSREVLPILPEQDIGVGAVMTVEQSLCDPSFGLAMNGLVPVGDEKIVVEGVITRKDNLMDLQTYVLRDYAPKLTILGTIQGDYSSFFHEFVRSGSILDWEQIIESMDLRLESTDFSLARLLRLMEIEGNIKGMLHASIAIAGHPTKPDIDGRIWLEEAFMGGVELQSPELSIRADEEYLFDGNVAFQEGFASLSGMMPRDMDSVSLTMSSDTIPLKAILGVIPETNQVQGHLSVNGDIQGPFDALTHSIRVQVDDGGVSYLPFNISVSDLNLDTMLDTEQIRISTCSMESGSLRSKERGTGSLKGTLRKEGMQLRSGNLQLSFDQFWMIDRSDQSYRFTGDLLARYMPKGVFDVSGSIVLNHGKILLDSGFFSDESTLSISPKIQLYRPEAQFSRVVETAEDSYGVEISKIDVDLNQQLYLTAEFPLLDDYNKQLSVLSTAYVDGIFDGDLTLSMDEESLSMEGSVYALRGDLKAMGAMFAISNANLSFFGRDYYNPIMDIQAVRTIDNYDVVTTLTGSVAAPQIAFSSTSAEPLSQTDIISLILFGRVASELGDNNPLLSSVMTSLSGSMNQLIGSSLVDRFSWDPSSQQIEIGMSLSEKLYLSITQVYQGENQDIQSQTMIGLEFFILKRMYMELQSNPSTGSLSGYVFHRWRY